MVNKKTTKHKHYRPAGKKKEGNAAKYVTRSQAIKKLQVSLSEFRTLCIFKGVFPREPKKKVKGNNHTYYHEKDISFLQHEPLLEKFREIRAYEKKIKKASAKKNKELATRLEIRKPTYKLDALVRERYPKFIEALRDLDDCLTMVHLFAALPAMEKLKINVESIHNCRRLSHEWQAYIARTHRLRKVFISVKGIYYQAEVEGQKITWLAPHAMQQVLPEDVNFSVMLRFLEFYETLLGFVNFRLYHSIKVKYPPILDSRLESLAADLYALARFINASSKAQDSATSSSQQQVDDETQQKGLQAESELRLAQLQHQLPSNEPGALMHLVEDVEVEVEDEDDQDTKECKKLFRNMKFFLSREVPRESLLFIIPAFGGIVSWEGEGAPFTETEESITHQVVDRPIQQGHKYLSREYIQPQWIFDCVNARIILPTQDYVVGRVPPPHLSPFIDNEAEGYVPDYAATIKRLQAAAKNEVLPITGIGKEDLDDPQKMLVEGYINRTEAIEAAERKRKMATLERQYHEELKMELEDAQYSSPASKKHKQSSEDKEGEDTANEISQIIEDSEKMSASMMTRNQRGLYKAIQLGKEKKAAKINKLKERKKKHESQASEQH